VKVSIPAKAPMIRGPGAGPPGNEWPAFTYEVGEYLITTSAGGWERRGLPRPRFRPNNAHRQGGHGDNARGRRAAEDMINIR
jgi:hypothetical protein